MRQPLWSILFLSLLAATTQPASKPMGPKQTLQILGEAIEQGDESRLKTLLYASSPSEQALVNAISNLASATKQLRTAAIATFGQEGSKGIVGDLTKTPADSLSGAKETIKGNIASVASPGSEAAPVILQYIDGSWRVPASELAKGLNSNEIRKRAADIQTQADVIDRTTRDMTAGLFHTSQEASEVLHARMLKSASELKTTSQPTTPK